MKFADGFEMVAPGNLDDRKKIELAIGCLDYRKYDDGYAHLHQLLKRSENQNLVLQYRVKKYFDLGPQEGPDWCLQVRSSTKVSRCLEKAGDHTESDRKCCCYPISRTFPRARELLSQNQVALADEHYFHR